MLIRLLGPIEVVDNSTTLRIPGQRCKTLVALLALENGGMISTDRLVDEIWGAQPPPTAHNSLANAIMRVRRVLGPERIVTGPGAYGLVVSPDELDLAQFESLLDGAQQQPFEQQKALLEQALGLFRGESFGGAQPTPLIEDAIRRTDAMLFEARLCLYEADIELEQRVQAAPIRSLIDKQPTNERAWALLGLAINNAGNPRLALDTIRLASDALRSSGLEPGEHLVNAEQRVLLIDPKTKFGADPAPLPRTVADSDDRRSGRAPLVGRDRELELLLDLVAVAKTGHASFALVIGEAGIGKSTLVTQILPRAIDDEITLVVCHCATGGRGPILELSSGLGIDTEALRPVEGVPQNARADSSDVLPLIIDRLRTLSKKQPTVLVIEDVHASPDIGLLIGDLIAAMAGHRIVIVATGRPGDSVDTLREHAAATSGTTITVDGLSQTEAADLLGPGRASEVATLIGETGGNPLYLLTGAALSEGGAGLEDYVRAELAQLDPTARSLAQLLGVHGGPMTHDELAAASGLGDDLAEALQPLLSSGLANEKTGRNLQIQIRHQMIGEAIAATLSGAGLVQLHRTIRDTILATAALDQGALKPATMVLAAHHAWSATASGNPADRELAAELCERAADAAQAHGEWAQASALYAQALDCHDGASAAGKDHDADEAAGRCMLGRAVALFHLGSNDSPDAFVEAANDASRRADGPMLADVVLAWDRGMFSQAAQVNSERLRLVQRALRNTGIDPARRARLLACYASELTFSDRWAERFAIADEALEASQSCDLLTQVYVLSHRQLTIACLETTDERARSADALVELASELRDPQLLFQAKFQRTGPAVVTGDLSLLDDLLDEADDLAQHLSIKLYKWLTHQSKSGLRLLQGDLDAGRTLSAEAFAMVKGTHQQQEAALIHGEQNCHYSRLTGDLGDLVPMLTQIGGGRGDGFTVAALLATAGDLESASDILDADGLSTVEELPRHILERPMLQNLATVADALNRVELGREVAGRLQKRPLDLGITGVAQPCGHHFTAIALRPSQQWAQVFAHHLAAVEFHERAHHRLLALESKRELVRSLIAADLDTVDLGAADLGVGEPVIAGTYITTGRAELRDQVNAEAAAMGMAGLTLPV
ncbi:MAG: AAA family ATPase [Acidimicrobiales bacterium]